MKSKSINIWGVILCFSVAWSFLMDISMTYQMDHIKGTIVTGSMDSLRGVAWSSIKNCLLVHSILWLIGLMALGWGGWLAVKQQSARQQVEKKTVDQTPLCPNSLVVPGGIYEK